MQKNKIINQVLDYYNEKLETFGATPRGVDWNSEESQELRFTKLLEIVETFKLDFSVLDYGCGFGAMYPFMRKIFVNDFSFTGFDISENMIQKAKENFANDLKSQWCFSLSENCESDYVIASGIFNVRLKNKKDEWGKYILETLTEMNKYAKKGFSFNMLTSYSDKEFMKEYLYYADPLFYFDFCKKNFSKYVTIMHDYPLYEFTILVKK